MRWGGGGRYDDDTTLKGTSTRTGTATGSVRGSAVSMSSEAIMEHLRAMEEARFDETTMIKESKKKKKRRKLPKVGSIDELAAHNLIDELGEPIMEQHRQPSTLTVGTEVSSWG